MHARTVTAQVTPEGLEGRIRSFRDEALAEFARQPGFQRTYLLVDRATGKTLALSLWDSEAARQAAEEAGAAGRRQALQAAGATGRPVIELFEVAVQS